MGLNEPDLKIGEVSLERMVRAVEKVRDRLLRAARALEASKIPYAVVGGNAGAAWVARVDESAVRNTQDVPSCSTGPISTPQEPPWQAQILGIAT